jgi:hypothetical protein
VNGYVLTYGTVRYGNINITFAIAYISASQIQKTVHFDPRANGVERRHSIGETTVGPLRGEKSGDYLS